MKSIRRRPKDPVLDATETFQAALDETSRNLAVIRRTLLEISHKLDALVEHLGVSWLDKPNQNARS